MATYKVRVEGKEYEVTVEDRPGGAAEVTVEGKTFHIEPSGAAVAAPAAPSPAPAAPSPTPSTAAAPAAKPAAPAGGSGAIHAPIPGVVTKILVSQGQAVDAGQIVLKLEAMKMENDIATPVAGTVKEIAVGEGSEVRDGQLLVVVA
ncbi:MAG: biotin/lipoyl-binding protein [Candidatus Dadabacteria bacterium]|nr:MAG: biotin/lipoyl-binding protein [Candidatus Dadabacteria bacterium]